MRVCVYTPVCIPQSYKKSTVSWFNRRKSGMKPWMEGASPVSLVWSLLVWVWCFGKGTGPQCHLVGGLCSGVEQSKKMKSHILKRTFFAELARSGQEESIIY